MRLIYIVPVVILSSWLSGCYVLKQGLRQNSLLNSRQPISEVIGDEKYDKKIRQKLEFSKEVLEFSSIHGLNTEQSYRYYVHLEGDAISYIVYAAEKARLEPKTWWFPVVGSVPYLGFFDEIDRDEKAKQLENEGYDVARGRVGAFSSLGWFEDPIYKPMLLRSASSLAHLLFHELTHRTFWSQGSVRFNENLAEFVANELTERFLKERKDFVGLRQYRQRNQDRAIYKRWLKELRSDLESLFASGKDEEYILSAKSDLFQNYLGPKYPPFQSESYRRIRNLTWNNAKVLSASLYSPDLERFKNAFNCMSSDSVGDFLQALKRAEDLFDESFAALDSLCHKG